MDYVPRERSIRVKRPHGYARTESKNLRDEGARSHEVEGSRGRKIKGLRLQGCIGSNAFGGEEASDLGTAGSWISGCRAEETRDLGVRGLRCQGSAESKGLGSEDPRGREAGGTWSKGYEKGCAD